ncbi:hypothetical protein FB45DRAFT_819021, partial [Roridomyces roridus]
MSQEMSTKGLEAEIAQVSVEIWRQKDVLRKLESSKSLLQQQLNAIRDPISRLPLEISSEIFRQCLGSGHPPGCVQPNAQLAPLVLLNICHTWTDVALSNPTMWASIHIPLLRVRTGRGFGFAELLGMWLRRAGSHPLQLFLEGACNL